MKRFFKSKFFYIAVAVALILVIVPSVLSAMGVSFFLRDAVNVVLTPLQKGFTAVGEALEGYSDYFTRFDELVKENAALREKVESLENQVYHASEIEKLYAWMSDFLEMKLRHNDFTFLRATITGRESNNYAKLLTLDVGSGSGVALHMPVVTADGIYGQVTEVGYSWCRVTSIADSTSSVGAYLERTGEEGICEGQFDLAPDGRCLLRYLPADSDVREGDRVLTSGLGSVYPRDLVIGFVETVETNPYNRGITVTVKCSADVADLSSVMVITSYETTAADGSTLTGGES